MQINEVLNNNKNNINIKNGNSASIGAIPKNEIEIILMHVLAVSRSYLYSYPEAQISSEKYEIFCALLERRLHGEPLAYILGNCSFWSLDLEIDNSVLIPRPETELLVEIALGKLNHKLPLRVADFGTGCGAIALALARECASWHVYATDINNKALQIAQNNAKKLSLSNITFLHGDWYDAFDALPQQLQHSQFSAIISNPPYVAVDDPYLQDEVKRFEPKEALFSGKDGLDAIRQIVAKAPQKLIDGGWLMLEHGFNQGEKVRALMAAQNFVGIETYKDLSGHERVTVGMGNVKNVHF